MNNVYVFFSPSELILNSLKICIISFFDFAFVHRRGHDMDGNKLFHTTGHTLFMCVVRGCVRCICVWRIVALQNRAIKSDSVFLVHDTPSTNNNSNTA